MSHALHLPITILNGSEFIFLMQINDDEKPESVIPDTSEEEKKFCGRHPWITIISLSVGPIILFGATPFYEALELFMVQRQYGDAAVSILGMGSIIRALIMIFAKLPSCSISVKVSSLIAEKKLLHASQLVNDLLRVSILVGVIFPLIMIPNINGLLKFMSVPSEFLSESAKLLLPSMGLMIFISQFEVFSQVLMGEGKAYYYAIVQICSLAFSLFIVDPLMIFYFKAPIWSLSFAFSSGQVISGFIMAIMFYRGKFTLQPSLSMLCGRFSSEFKSALLITVPYFLYFFAGFVPPLILMKLILQSSQAAGIEGPMSSVLTSSLKVYSFFASINSGCLQGLPPAGAFAYAKKMYRRLISLFGHSMIIPFIVTSSVSTIMIFYPKQVLRIWIRSPISLEIANKFVPRMFYTYTVLPFAGACNMFFLSMKKSFLGSINPIVQSLSLLVGSIVLYNIFPNNPYNIIFALACQDVSAVISSLICLMSPLFEILNSREYQCGMEETSELNHELNNA